MEFFLWYSLPHTKFLAKPLLHMYYVHCTATKLMSAWCLFVFNFNSDIYIYIAFSLTNVKINNIHFTYNVQINVLDIILSILFAITFLSFVFFSFRTHWYVSVWLLCYSIYLIIYSCNQTTVIQISVIYFAQ